MHLATGQDHDRRRRAVDIPLLVILFGMIGLCVILVLTSRGMLFPETAETEEEVVTHHLQFAGRNLRVRETWLVARSHAPGEPRLSLRVPLKDILPDQITRGDAVTVALSPEDASLPPADLPRMLYARFLSSEATAVSGNLVRRPFHTNSPYAGEVLLIAPPEGRHFSARCDQSDISPIEPSCFAQIRRAGLDIEIQITKRDIVHWERIAAWIAGVLIMPGDAGTAATSAPAPGAPAR
jgi:hypothetical protein